MRAALLGCCVGLIVAIESVAHRLDEYLQATRVAVATNRLELSFELTPGVAVVGTVLDLVDPDRDGFISTDERQAYAQRFLKDLSVGLDGKAVALRVTSVVAPTVAELRTGTGAIRIRAISTPPLLSTGSHTLTVTNRHLSAISVYLVNALRSENPAVEIGKQSRDELQKDYQLEFRVLPLAK